MYRVTIQCNQCKEEVGDEATKCPKCEYNPGRSKRKSGSILLLCGILISVTIIGSPLGIPIAILGAMQALKGDGLTVDYDPSEGLL